MFKTIFILLFIMSFPLHAKSVLQVGCTLFDEEKGLIKNFPGLLCYFKNNGDRIEVHPDRMDYINATDSVVWTQKGMFHHQFKVDEGQNFLAAIGESAHNIQGCKTRFDVINIFNQVTGKEIKRIDFYDLFKDKRLFQNDGMPYLRKASFRKTQGQYGCDTTHANSIFQLGENSLENINPAFKRGNWLINFSWAGQIIIFDSTFSNILWTKKIDIHRADYHDIHLVKDGKIIVYLNGYYKKSLGRFITAIAEIDPLKDDASGTKIIEPMNNDKLFNQDLMGGVQYLNNGDKILSVFNDTEGYQVAFYNSSWKQLKKMTPFPHSRTSFGSAFQEAKLVEITDFFKNYKGQL